MPVRLSGLNLLNRFLLFIYAASLQSRRYARNYVAQQWMLASNDRCRPVIIDYCGVGQRAAVTD
jgi:hypothetical protein